MGGSDAPGFAGWPPRPGYYAEVAVRLMDEEPQRVASALVYAALEQAAATDRVAEEINRLPVGQ